MQIYNQVHILAGWLGLRMDFVTSAFERLKLILNPRI